MDLSVYLFVLLLVWIFLFIFFVLLFRLLFPLAGAARASIWSLVFSAFFTTLLGILMRDNVTYTECQPVFGILSCANIQIFVLLMAFFISWLVIHLMLFYIGPSAGNIIAVPK